MSGARLWPGEAEAAVLGAILSAASYSADAGIRIVQRAQKAGLTPDHFGVASYAELFRVLCAMANANVPVDAVSVAAELDRTHDDPHLIARLRVLAAEVPAFNALERHVELVVDAAVRREVWERSR